jgi:hypothetical protein
MQVDAEDSSAEEHFQHAILTDGIRGNGIGSDLGQSGAEFVPGISGGRSTRSVFRSEQWMELVAGFDEGHAQFSERPVVLE